ncbi:DNA cytosine methyltransferase [Pedobacter yonginense]|uniref:DNA (cytosine-5-)-methyltransferase n=1 Tax=Pedobacter yonginense TaxID=651869 RepID=A0A317EP87_9SPHI|nr:DNA cytosine methyltransferase [Pedobacter yonginense]PWS27106.1 DNA cytosine methyltransferase [Pedobacter yonginense]
MILEQRGFTVNDQIEKIIDSKVNAIGFFSGAGGLDIGSQLAGAKVISSLDFDVDSVKTMNANKYFNHAVHYHKDIQAVTAEDYKELLKANNPEKLILIGGPPCQPFSKGGYWVTHDRRKANDDPRNMIGNYLRVISDLRPDGFLLENVESILHPTNKIAVENLKNSIDQLGYDFQIVKSNALDYGVPQKRKRVFFLASRKKFIGEPIKTHGSSDEIKLNPSLLPYENVGNWIEKYNIEKFFENEELTTGKTYSQELMAVPPGKNYIALTSRHNYPDPKFTAGTRFWNFLLKLDPKLPSWTISAQPGPWVGPFHWSGRRLRVPEIAALQTFPEDYIFVGNRRSIQKQIGNAVPSLLGKSMVEHLISNIS